MISCDQESNTQVQSKVKVKRGTARICVTEGQHGVHLHKSMTNVLYEQMLLNCFHSGLQGDSNKKGESLIMYESPKSKWDQNLIKGGSEDPITCSVSSSCLIFRLHLNNI